MIIRPATHADLPALIALAQRLDTVNLPDEPALVEQLIGKSERSFAALAEPPGDRRMAQYTLVAEGETGVVGTASLFAEHGTVDEPHFFLTVERTQAHSKQLGESRDRTLLRLGRDCTPWTELGGLVVHPEARGQGLGKLLVAARLLLVAMYRDRFYDRLLAELLPPRRDEAEGGGGNAFWDAVGSPLTGLPYYRADLLCRTDKEFIEAFFPHAELVAELLPPAARELIAQVGGQTLPVRKLLTRAGFRWLGTIDPFDAGPHDGAAVADISPITRTRRLVCLDLPPQGSTAEALVGSHVSHRQSCCAVEIAGDGIRLADEQRKLLEVHPGDTLWAMPLGW